MSAEAGATWGEFDRETQPLGWRRPEVISSTGIAGLTLGGGKGYLQRTHGMSCDNLLSADVVTADGRLLRRARPRTPTCSGDYGAAAAYFGVVTSFEYRLHPVGPVLAGAVLHPFSAAREAFAFYRD